MAETDEHPAWPGPGEHLWSEWQAKTGLPKPTQWRVCLHPACHEVQERPWSQTR